MRWMTTHNTHEERPDEDADQSESMTGMSADQDLAPVTNLRPTVGDELRMRREEAGHSLADVAEAIRIQRRYLEALEDGRIEDLPGTVYALGFLRTYSEYYGFSGDAFVTRYKEETEGQRHEQDYTLPEPIEEARVPTAAIVIVAIILAIGAYVAWYTLQPQNTGVVSTVPEVPPSLASAADETLPAIAPALPEPEPIAAAAVEPEPPPAATNAESAEIPTAVSEPGTPPAPTTQQTESEPANAPPPVAQAPPVVEEVAALTPPEPPASDAPVAEEVVHTPQNYGTSYVDARIVITALDDSWIEISDTEGNRLMSRTLRAGDSYRVPNRDGLVFVTGNAGGLEISVDGAPTPAIGDVGIVRKNVKLDPDLLKAGRAWP